VTADELRDYLASYGRDARVRRGQVQVNPCPYCGNERWNLEASTEKGVFNCWACDAGRGKHLGDLLEYLGIPIPPDLESFTFSTNPPPKQERPAAPELNITPASTVASAMAYLKRRGLTITECLTRRIGVCRTPGEWYLRIIVPLKEYWSGASCGYIGRAYAPTHKGAKYRAEMDCPVSLPGWRTSRRVHVLCEGPFDALAVNRLGYGAAFLSGVQREEQALRWACQAPATDTVLVMLDADARQRATRLHRMINAARPTFRIDLPEGEDPASMPALVLGEMLDRVAGGHTDEEPQGITNHHEVT